MITHLLHNIINLLLFMVKSQWLFYFIPFTFDNEKEIVAKSADGFVMS